MERPPVPFLASRCIPFSICVLSLFGSSPASAQVFESVGTRALGMGGAFVAVADDATAAYWNPAGLTTGAFFSLLVDQTFTRTRLDPTQPDSPGTDQGGIIVSLSTNTAALSYYRLRINQIDRPPPPAAPLDPARKDQWGEAALRSIVTHNVAMTGVQMLYPGVSFGSTVRYVRGSYGVGAGNPDSTTGSWLREAGDLKRHSQNKVDMDMGLKIGGEKLQVGLVARNLLTPSLDAPDGRSIRLERLVRAGLAVRPVGRLLVAADIDLRRLSTAHGGHRNVAIGVEQWFGVWLGVRGGARFNLEGGDDDPGIIGAVGLSVLLTSGLYVDAQVTRGRDEVEQGWSVAGRVGF